MALIEPDAKTFSMRNSPQAAGVNPRDKRRPVGIQGICPLECPVCRAREDQRNRAVHLSVVRRSFVVLHSDTKKNRNTVRILKIKMVVGDGFEPSKAWPVDLQSTAFDRSATPPEELLLERVEGIEPSQLAWKANVLPLNYTRRHFSKKEDLILYIVSRKNQARIGEKTKKKPHLRFDIRGAANIQTQTGLTLKNAESPDLHGGNACRGSFL